MTDAERTLATAFAAITRITDLEFRRIAADAIAANTAHGNTSALPQEVAAAMQRSGFDVRRMALATADLSIEAADATKLGYMEAFHRIDKIARRMRTARDAGPCVEWGMAVTAGED